MADFIVDESRFIIADGEQEEWFIPQGFELPDGLIIDEKVDEADAWQLYITDDGSCQVLACREELAGQWVANGLPVQDKLYRCVQGETVYQLLISPCTLKLLRLTQIRCRGSARYALSLAAAFWHTRSLLPEVNLRDALYVEKLGLLLPTFSLVPPITDRALFENLFREDKDPENLEVPGGAGNGGLSWFTVRKMLKAHGIALAQTEPWLEQGEPLDDFMEVPSTGAYVTGPLVLSQHYQIFDTSAGRYVLLMDKLWSEALLQTNLLNRISLNNISLNHTSYAVLTFDKRRALEPLNDRFHGLTAEGALRLAQCMQRTRAQFEQASLKDALYLEALGVLLPVSFMCDSHDDVAVLGEILNQGPFALGPLLDAVKVDCMMIATGR